MADFYIKQNDRRPVLRATLYSGTGAVMDLTGATVKFFMAANPHASKVNGATCDIIDATNGIVEYPWAVGDTSDAGKYKGEFEVTHTDGKKETVPSDGYFTIEIGSELE